MYLFIPNGWRVDHPEMDTWATPLVVEHAGRQQVIVNAMNRVRSYDLETGKIIWEGPGTTMNVIPSPVSGLGMVFISAGFSKGEVFALKLGGQGALEPSQIAWSMKKSAPTKPSLLLVNDLIYMMNDGGIATCADAKTGESIWSERVQGNYSASPIFADGRICVFSEEGKAAALAPGREFKLLAENKLDGGFMASPAVSGKALFLRTKTHLYRVEE